MISRILRYVVLPIYIISCATNSLSRLPEITHRNSIRTLSSAQLSDEINKSKSTPYLEYQARYLLAMKTADPVKACADFTNLAQEKDFWAKPLVKIRMYAVCPKDTLSPTDIDEIRVLPWYKYEFLKVATAVAKSTRDLENEMAFGFEYSELQTRKQDRIVLLQRSLTLAKDLHKKAEEDIYLNSLYQVAPRFLPQPQPADYLNVANDFRNAREFSKAKKYYQLVSKNKNATFDDRYKAYDGIAKNYKIQNLKSEYLKALKRQTDFIYSTWKQDPRNMTLLKKLEDAFIVLARAQWTEQETSKALKTLRRIEKILLGRDGLDQVYWIRGRIEEEAGHYDQALEWIEKSIVQPGIDPAVRETAMWQSAWLLKKTGRLNEALEAFRNLKDTALTPFGKTKYSFWFAKTLNQTGNNDPSEYENIIKTDPFSYYSLVAHKELKKTLNLSDFKSSANTFPSPPGAFEDVLFNWLIDVNEVELARSLLENYLLANPKESLAQSTNMALVGLFNRIYLELGAMDFEVRNKFISENMGFFFPRSFKADFQSASFQTGVDENFLMAITRQESGFDPYARSAADAFGLMQLLPSTAEVYAKKLNLNYTVAEDLYNPALNIPIGANLILNLLGRFNYAFIPAVASYNASEDAVRGWIKTRYRGDPIDFIEEVPYEETKSYIKLVTRNRIFYQLLNSPFGQIDFPAQLLTVE